MTWSSVNSDSGNAQEFLADTWTVTIKTFVFVRQCNGIRNHWTWEVNFFFRWMNEKGWKTAFDTYVLNINWLFKLCINGRSLRSDCYWFFFPFSCFVYCFWMLFYSNCMHLFGYNCLLHRSIRRTTKEQPKCHTIDRTKPKTLYANEKWINGITMTQ